MTILTLCHLNTKFWLIILFLKFIFACDACPIFFIISSYHAPYTFMFLFFVINFIVQFAQSFRIICLCVHICTSNKERKKWDHRFLLRITVCQILNYQFYLFALEILNVTEMIKNAQCWLIGRNWKQNCEKVFTLEKMSVQAYK